MEFEIAQMRNRDKVQGYSMCDCALCGCGFIINVKSKQGRHSKQCYCRVKREAASATARLASFDMKYQNKKLALLVVKCEGRKTLALRPLTDVLQSSPVTHKYNCAHEKVTAKERLHDTEDYGTQCHEE